MRYFKNIAITQLLILVWNNSFTNMTPREYFIRKYYYLRPSKGTIWKVYPMCLTQITLHSIKIGNTNNAVRVGMDVNCPGGSYSIDRGS